MELWRIVLWTVMVVCACFGFYGLHRLGLWMEDRGYIYYVRKKPTGSAIGSFVALQKIIEPQVQHVIQAARVNQLAGDEDRAGQGDRQPPHAGPAGAKRKDG
jgi:hypothetical protein